MHLYSLSFQSKYYDCLENILINDRLITPIWTQVVVGDHITIHHLILIMVNEQNIQLLILCCIF